MEVITKTPGFQHLSEDILKLLDKKSLMDCRIVNSSWKTILDQPTFWLKKMKMSDMPKLVQNQWKMIASKLEDVDDTIYPTHKFVLAMIKICQSKRNFPLEIVMDLEEAGRDPYDLKKFILEHYDQQYGLGKFTSKKRRKN